MTDTKRTFDQQAAGWDKNQRRLDLAQSVSTAITKVLQDQSLHDVEAMEYGCGTGLVGLTLASQFKTLLAVDTSEAMLGVLAEKIASEKRENVTTQLIDLQFAELNQNFDLIFSSMTLHHVPNSSKLLVQLVKHLRPTGILAIADLDKEDGSFHQGSSPDHHHNGFNREELTQQLKQLGMDTISFQTVHTIIRTNEEGQETPFTVFLMTAHKE